MRAASRSVRFANPAPGGYPGFLTVTVDPLTLTPGGTTPITGSVAVAFVTPEQTYTSNNLGPPWAIRVGAVDRAGVS